MKKILIKGKEYIEVNERLKYYKEHHPNHPLTSEILYWENGEIIIKAEIKNEDGVVVADGIAHEKANSSHINKTSYVENCQTSAWGRALACFGIGIDTSIASSDEVKATLPPPNKQTNNNATQAQYRAIYKLGSEAKMTKGSIQEMGRWYRDGDAMTKDEASQIIENFDRVRKEFLEETNV
jgi:hypothetical protein